DQEQSYCIKILYFYFCGDFLDPPSPIWITFEELQENLNGNYSPVCGNGVIEFGEQCDGSQLGTMSDCATHGSITGAGNWTSGEITCNEYYCYWEYDNCQ
nr:hypothetical protein [Deltaproteobacteria bacterium]